MATIANVIGKQEIWLEAVVRAFIHHIKYHKCGKCEIGELGSLSVWKRAKDQVGCATLRDFLEQKRLRTVFKFEGKRLVSLTALALQLRQEDKAVPLTERQRAALGPRLAADAYPCLGVQLPACLSSFLPSFPLVSTSITSPTSAETRRKSIPQAEHVEEQATAEAGTKAEPALTFGEAVQKFEHLIRKRINKTYIDKHKEDRGWCWLADLAGGFAKNPLWLHLSEGNRNFEKFIAKSPAFVLHVQKANPKKPSQKPYVTLGSFSPDGRRGSLPLPVDGIIGGSSDAKGKLMSVNALGVAYTHSVISRSFQSGTLLDKAIKDILYGVSPETFPPMEVVWHDGVLYSLSNRRLFLYRTLTNLHVIGGVRVVLQDARSGRLTARKWDDRLGRMATKWERSYTTFNDGESVIVDSEFQKYSHLNIPASCRARAELIKSQWLSKYHGQSASLGESGVQISLASLLDPVAPSTSPSTNTVRTGGTSTTSLSTASGRPAMAWDFLDQAQLLLRPAQCNAAPIPSQPCIHPRSSACAWADQGRTSHGQPLQLQDQEVRGCLNTAANAIVSLPR